MRKEWLFAVLLAGSMSGSAAIANDAECSLRKLATIELAMRATPRMVLVPVTLQGHDAWMMLDTASGSGALSGSAVRSFGLHVKPLSENTAPITFGGRPVEEIASVDSLQIGDAKVNGTSVFLVADRLPMTPYEGAPIVGYLGMELFGHMDVELDLAHQTMNLFSQDHCGSVVYWADSAAAVPIKRGPLGNLYFPMEFNGRRIETEISTTQLNSSIFTDVTKQLFHFDEHSPGNEVDTTSGHPTVFYRAMKLTNPGLTVTNAKIQLLPPINCPVGEPLDSREGVGYYKCNGYYPLLLGLSVIEKLRLYFATKEHVLYLTASGAADPEAAQQRATVDPK